MTNDLVDRISRGLLVPADTIRRTAQTASKRYKTFTIAKRDGGKRTIHHPSRRLKALQRWLALEIIGRFPVHASATAYREGMSIINNATAHVEGAFLLRMDFKDFFESISGDDIRAFLGATSSLREDDIDIFVKIVCLNDALTIGSPSSPPLANAICFALDSSIAARCMERDVKYTRYADDLFFSSARPNVLRDLPDAIERIVRGLPYPARLAINAKKTRHSSKKTLRRVTGLTLTPVGKVVVGRSLKRSVRARIHKFDTLSGAERQRLRGHITYVQSVDRNFINALILKYGSQLITRVLVCDGCV